MSYTKADKILPTELIQLIQQYIDGEYIYIPRKEDNKKLWGSCTNSREELRARNAAIYSDYLAGMTIENLTEKYYLSSKSIQRIVLQEKRKCA
jgi:Mor family transcriptional regulator